MDTERLSMRKRVERAIALKQAGIETYKKDAAILKQQVRKLQKALDAGLYDGMD